MYYSANKGGKVVGSFPDACKTPIPIVGVKPIPYTNIKGQAGASLKQGEKAKNDAHKKTQEAKQELDNAFRDVDQLFGRIDVKFEGKLGFDLNTLKAYNKAIQKAMEAAHKLHACMHNGGQTTNGHFENDHTVAQQIAPQQTKVQVSR